MSSTDTATLTTLLILSVVWLLVGVGFYVWYAWALSRLFKQLGTDGWRGWVPVLNEMTLLERGGVAPWNVVFYFLPIVNLYGLYLKFTAANRIGERFGRGTGFAVLGALLTPVWATLLVLQRTPAPGTAPHPTPHAAQHRQMAGGMAGPEQPRTAQSAPQLNQPEPAMPTVSQPAPPAPAGIHPGAPTPTPVAAALQAPSAPLQPPVASTPVPPPTTPVDLTPPAPQAPMPEPAPPESPPAGVSTDSGPILVHNPWARPAAEAPAPSQPPTPASPPPNDVPTWLDNPATASAPVTQPPSVDDDDDDGATVVVDRRPQVQWHLNVDGAEPLPLVGDKVILGRRPTATVPGIHPLAVPDTTRTLSKAHAQLELSDGEWSITDLNSTNGVLLVDEAGEETLITPGQPVPVPGRFILGKVGMSISFEQAGA